MYKDFRNDTWEELHKDIQRGNLYIWGAGKKGQEIVKKLKAFGVPWKICGFIDSDESIKECEGFRVYSSSYLKEIACDQVVILISLDKPGLVVDTIEKYGIKKYYSYFWLNEELKDYRLQEDMDEAALSKVSSLLADEKSKEILQAIIVKRKHGILDYTDIMCSGSEYFREEFFSPTANEVFVDGGGFDGDTVEEFFLWTGGEYDKIYSFEPDSRMMKKIEVRTKNWHDVRVLPYGLWNEHTVKKFHLDNYVYSSRIDDVDEGECIQCVPLDEILAGERCTFLKMDIEGAELSALYGAYKTIINNKPKIAVCIYHLPTDLWKIPLLIHQWVPEYKFYIRHFGARYFSTVLFAV